MAFVFAVILLAFAGYDRPEVLDVMEGYPAQEAGLKAGDMITKINHTSIHFTPTWPVTNILRLCRVVQIQYFISYTPWSTDV